MIRLRRFSTIFALATAKGRAGVGIIRVSGPNTEELLKNITKSDKAIRNPKLLSLSPFYGRDQSLIDRGMAVFFKGKYLLKFPYSCDLGPHSFTGEDVAELHIHSAPAIIERLLTELGSYPDTRVAEAGEFTRRAFDNGRLDLSQVEGLADLLAAETESQLKVALLQTEGHIGRQFNAWRQSIIECMAMTEAWIDFAEDENIELDTMAVVASRVSALHDELTRHLEASKTAEIARNGFKVAIIGPPNAGKSSLLNRLAKREAAIVSPIAGTTRDVLQVSLQIGGYPVILSDTAGLRDASQTDDPIELEGIKRAKQAASDADLIILLRDGSNDLSQPTMEKESTSCISVINKIDLWEGSPKDYPPSSIKISCKTEEGINELISEIQKEISRKTPSALAEISVIVQARHKSHVQEAIGQLDAFLLTHKHDCVLAAQHLKMAAVALGQITGHINPEEVLDALFSTFCIGK